MKFNKALPVVLAAFSPVHSQKVDPFASSSSVVATGKDDVSPITNADPPASGTTTPNTEQHQEIKESIANGRELNGVCKKFVNYIAVDGTTLQEWCIWHKHNCCQGWYDQACINWSPDATYEVCENSCNNERACRGVANKASSGATIKFDVGSCNGEYSCDGMAKEATNLQTLTVGKNSCSGLLSCSEAAALAESLKQLIIADEQCKSSATTFGDSCEYCGRDSTFDDTLQLTETCCAEETDEAQLSFFDVACNYRVPSTSPSTSSIPSISSIPSDQPSSSLIPSDIPSDSPSDQPSLLPSLVPSDIPSDSPSDQPSLLPSLVPSDIPSDSPSDQPSLLPSLVPSDIPSNSPSDQPSSLPTLVSSDIPSDSPSDQPSSEPTWLDDEQCKKKDPDNDICKKIGGRCKIDCEDDENYVCVPGLCLYDKKWNKPNKNPKLRELMTNEEFEMVEMEVSAIGNTGRELKTPKVPKANKAPKSSCACRVPVSKLNEICK